MDVVAPFTYLLPIVAGVDVAPRAIVTYPAVPVVVAYTGRYILYAVPVLFWYTLPLAGGFADSEGFVVFIVNVPEEISMAAKSMLVTAYESIAACKYAFPVYGELAETKLERPEIIEGFPFAYTAVRYTPAVFEPEGSTKNWQLSNV